MKNKDIVEYTATAAGQKNQNPVTANGVISQIAALPSTNQGRNRFSPSSDLRSKCISRLAKMRIASATMDTTK